MTDRLGPAVSAGCRFIAERQDPSGAVPIEVAADHEHDGAWVPDPTVFAAAVTGLCLRSVPDPRAQLVVRRASVFLRRERGDSGAWRFWTDAHRWSDVIPFDSDDTACAAVATGAAEDPDDPVVSLLAANRGLDGCFRTWFVPHRGRTPRSVRFWRTAASGLRRPLQRRAFWRLTEAEPDDVDAVVCANVLLAVGNRPEGRASAAHIVDLVRRGREAGSDKWYPRALALHHAVARAATRATALTAVRERSIARILRDPQDDGRLGQDVLDTALAVAALGHWGYHGPELDGAVDWLVEAQGPDGGWPTAAYYAGGPRDVTRWGSRELTTAFCVEALAAALPPGTSTPPDHTAAETNDMTPLDLPHLLHIGFPKTGSTSLQAWFDEHPQIRYSHGGLAGFHHLLDLADATSTPDRPVRALVTSAEDLSQPKSRDPDAVPTLGIAARRRQTCNLLHSIFGDAQILIVTRGWDGLLGSVYSEYLRRGGHEPFDTLLSGASPVTGDRIEDHFDYDATVALYEEVFGPDRVLVLPFELLRDDPRRFLSAVERRLGLEPSDEPLPRVHVGLGRHELVWYPRFAAVAWRISGLLGAGGPRFLARYQRHVGGTAMRRTSRILGLVRREPAPDLRSHITPDARSRLGARAVETVRLPHHEPYGAEYADARRPTSR